MPKGSRKSNKNHKKNTARKTVKNNKSSKKPIIVGLIYAEWCGHCKSMKEDWEKLTTFLNGKVAKVDKIESADSDKETKINELNNKYGGERLNGDSFPVIFKIQNNKIETYNGMRDFESMKSWVFTMSDPTAVLKITQERILEPRQYNGNEAQLMVKQFMERIRGGYQYNSPIWSKKSKKSKSPKGSKKSKSL
uniref:Thioredoxin domain-containing protein n=1 Tax=viral metagenome TaxID=1070528 RepID=A0A6C0DJD5_9ZZZZ